jgi:hypothetical protein
LKRIRLDEIKIKGATCIWDGCSARFEGDQPPGWIWLLGYSSPRPLLDLTRFLTRSGHTMVDSALCPEHAAALRRLLKWLVDPALLDPDPKGAA